MKIVKSQVPLNPTEFVNTVIFKIIGKNIKAPRCEVRGIRSRIAAMICSQPRDW